MTGPLAPRVAGAAILIGALILLSVIDFRTRRLPDRIVLPMLWAGLVLNAWAGAFAHARGSVLGAAAGYLALQLLSLAWAWRRRGPAFGGGDFKLTAMIGAWVGISALPAVLFVAFVSGTLITIPALLLGRTRFSQIVPFGPALALGAAAALAFGPSLAGLLPV